VTDAWTSLAYLSAGLISGLVISLLSQRTPREKLDYFFRLLRTPVREGEHVAEPCTLPENPAEPIAKLFDHPDIEIPRPTKGDIGGFALAWVFVALIIWMTWWLSQAA